MAASAGTVTLNLDANSVKLLRELQKSERASRKTSRQIGADFARMGAAIGASAAAAAGAMTLITKRAVDLADKIGKTADKVGVSTSSLQELRFAAAQAGVAQNALDMGLQRFSRRVGEAVRGQGELKDTLKQYNIELKNADGSTRNVEAILRDYADAIANASSSQEQLRLAFKGFDSEGAALVNLFRGGAKAIEDYAQQARRLGIVLEETLIRDAEEVANKMDILNRVLQVKVSAAVLENAEAIGALTTALIKLAGVAGGAVSNIGLVFAAITGNLGDKRELEKLRVDSQKLDLELITIQRRRDTALKSGAEKTVAIFDTQIADIRARRSQIQEEIKRLTVALNPPGGFLPADAPDGEGGGGDTAQKATEFISNLENKLRGLVLSDSGAIEVELRLLGASDKQIEQAIALASGIKAIEEANESLKASEAALKKQEADDFAALAQSMDADFNRIGEIVDDAFQFDDEFERAKVAAEQVTETFDIMGEFAVQAARNIQTALADFLFDPFQDGLDGMLKGFLDTMRRMIAEIASQAILRSLFGGFSGQEGFLGAIGDFVTGKRAAGGPVSAGGTYLVGERGPELFAPSTSGTIIPNSAMGGQIVFQIDARGADAQLTRALPAILEGFGNQIKNDIRTANARGRAA